MAAKKAPSDRLSLQEKEWPAVDREAWQTARRPGDMFDEHVGWASNWSDAAIKGFIYQYGRWLGWVLRAYPETVELRPEQRVTPDRIKEYVEHLAADALSQVTVHGLVRRLLTGMLMFAPQVDWRWLKVVETNLRKSMRPSIDKRHQIRPVRDLYAYGIELMEEAERSSSLRPRHRAIRYRDGLLIVIFASRAPRRGVVTLMEIDKHLIREGDLFWIVFDEHEMKGGRHSEKYLPKHLTPYMELYLDRYRRVLLRDPAGPSKVSGLWIAEHGGPIDGPGIHSAVSKRTLARFGIAIPPHRFRDCMATSFAYEDPANLGTAAPVLDHTSTDIADKHYNQAQAHVALTQVHSNLDALRDELKPYYERWLQERQEVNANDRR